MPAWIMSSPGVELAMSDDLYKRIGERIRAAREKKGYTQAEVARVLGYTQTAVSKFERGEREISLVDLRKIANLLGQPMSYFLSLEEELRLSPAIAEVLTDLSVTVLPVYGPVPAGRPVFVMEKPNEYIKVPTDFLKSARFGVRVRGDSMVGLGIHDGDILLVRPQNTADHGDIVIARIDGEEYTIKRLNIKNGKPILEPANPRYSPIVSEDLHIVGKAVRVVRDL